MRACQTRDLQCRTALRPRKSAANPARELVSGVCNHDPRGNAVYTEYFAKGTAPTEVCDKHVEVTVCAESGMRPTPYCPTKTTRVSMSLPEGRGGSHGRFRICHPGLRTIHSDVSTIIPPNTGDSDNTGPTVTPIGPGYQSPQESTEGFGPGEPALLELDLTDLKNQY